MKRSDNINELAVALAKTQSQLKGAVKDSVNPHLKSRYADLASVWDACREALAANGLAVSQHPSSEGTKIELTSLLMHSSGQWLESTLTMTSEKNTPQAIGSCLTYARRYALAAIVGVIQEDDDGHNSSSSNERKPAPPPAAAPAPMQVIKKDADIYKGMDEQKERLKQAAKEAGLNAKALPALHQACIREKVPMHLLGQAAKEFLTEGIT